MKWLHRSEVYAGSSRDIQQIIDNGFQQRNSFLAANRFRFSFRITWDERAVGAGGGFGVAEYLDPVVDLFFEFVFVDEAVDLHGAEEVADAFADAAFIQATPCTAHAFAVIFIVPSAAGARRDCKSARIRSRVSSSTVAR